jgi:ubiquinone/menaquinone biosynthesis C-methylase UbiE
MIQTNQQPVAEWLKSAELRSRIASSQWLQLLNAARIAFSFSGRRDRHFIDHLRGRNNLKILDIGCGSGRYYLSRFGEVSGLDNNAALLAMADSVYSETKNSSLLEPWPLPNNTFDVVMSSDVLGHFEGFQQNFIHAESRRVLKDGGQILHCLETVGSNPWYRMFNAACPDRFKNGVFDIPGHIGMEYPSQALARLSGEGFSGITCKALSGFVQHPGSLSSLAKNIGYNGWLSPILYADNLLSKCLVVRELVSLFFELFAKVEDLMAPIDWATGILVSGFKK